MGVTDKIIIITGASQGLGKELSLQLGVMGAKIALVARTESLLQDLKNQIKSASGEAEYFICDITNRSQIDQTVTQITKTFGTIDMLVNCAGIWTTTEFEEHKPELIQHAFEVNSIGLINFTYEVLPILKHKKYGHIVNIVSTAGYDIPDNKDWPVYTSTKMAVRGFSKALRHQLDGTKIKVSELYPGGFESNIFETLGEVDAHNQPWMMKTSQVAEAVVYMLNTPEDLCIREICLTKI